MTNSEAPVKRYADMEALARALAGDIAAQLAAAITKRGVASLVVSGGRSPVKLFEHLRVQPLDWSRVCVALADERWVDPSERCGQQRTVGAVVLLKTARRSRASRG